MATITPRELTEDSAPAKTAWLIVDTGSAVRKTAIEDVVASGRPLANQSEAETGTDAEKGMTPLTTKQAHDYRLTQAETVTGVKTFTPSSLTGQSMVVKVSDDTASAGPFLEIIRDSASPAASDLLGGIRIKGKDSADNETSYVSFRGKIVDHTDGSEDGSAQVLVLANGLGVIAASWEPGYVGGAATGGSQGVGTVNATGYYRNGANIIAHMDTVTAAAAWTPVVAPNYIRVAGHTTVGLGAALYALAVSEPSHDGKFSLTLADGVTVKWFELYERERCTPEMFGATPGKSNNSTTALAKMVSYVNATSTPIHLQSLYKSTTALAFTCDGLVIEGKTAQNTGFFFDDCDGIDIDHTALTTFSRFVLRNFALLTAVRTTRTALNFEGVSGTGGGDTYRLIEGLHFCGEGMFDKGDAPVSGDSLTVRAAGWLDNIKGTECDNVTIKGCRINGSWQDWQNNDAALNPKFPVNSAGIRLIGCTGAYIEDNKVYFTKYGFHISGQCEGTNLIRNVAGPVWDGYTFVDLVTPCNYQQVIGNHATAYNRGIAFCEDQTGHGSVMNRFSDNLLFMFPGNNYSAATDYRHLVISCARSEVRSNYFYVASGDSAATLCPTAIEVQAAANQITHNQFDGINVFITFGASGQNSLVAFNQSFASEGVGSVDPVVDGGANNVYAFNMGDKAAQWDTKPWFGTRTSNADAAINGYVQIRDAAGTIRKLACIA